MKPLRLLALVATVLTYASVSGQETTWLTDMDAAKATAAKESKYILLAFSGSDWCGNCMRLEQTLFHSVEFEALAAAHLVLVNADFPMRKKNKLSPAQTAHNEALAEQYNSSGAFPTVVVLDATGKVVGKLSTPQDSKEAYLRALKTLIGA